MRLGTLADGRARAHLALRALGALAGGCEWFDGELQVALLGRGLTTGVEVTTDLGAGLSERVLPALVVHASLTEFYEVFDAAPALAAPLVFVLRDGDRATLAAGEEAGGWSEEAPSAPTLIPPFGAPPESTPRIEGNRPRLRRKPTP